MEDLLSLRNFSVTYKNKEKRVHAVRNVNLTISRGESVGLVGESGSGKSTLAMAFLRLLPEHSTIIEGEADFLGQNLITLDNEKLRSLRWLKLSVVFQKAMNSFSPVHRVGSQIEDIYRVHMPDASQTEIKERVLYLLGLVNLPERVYRLYPHEMSGGMIQRVSVAVSLLHNPDLLVMDEATTALDVITQGQILKEIVDMEKELNVTRLMITHDISVVSASCKKIAVMYAGEMLEIGDVNKVLTNPAHPYTRGLLESFPSLKGDKKDLKSIGGTLPDLSLFYEGCVFEPRCPHAAKNCKSEKPALRLADNGAVAACHLCGGNSEPS